MALSEEDPAAKIGDGGRAAKQQGGGQAKGNQGLIRPVLRQVQGVKVPANVPGVVIRVVSRHGVEQGDAGQLVGHRPGAGEEHKATRDWGGAQLFPAGGDER